MKKATIIILFVFEALTAFCQNIDTLVFVDNFVHSDVAHEVRLPISKNLRKSARNGAMFKFNDSFYALEDSVRKSIMFASELWECKLPSGTLIKLEILFEDIQNDMEVLVRYKSNDMQKLTYPSSLYNNSIIKTEEEGFDGTIIFSNTINWDCSYNTGAVSDKNLSYAMLRAIAICLGHGASIKRIKNNLLSYHSSKRSAFDAILTNSNNDSLPITRNELTNFYTNNSNNIFANCQNGSIKMYAPEIFEQGKSLVYTDNIDWSLMKANMYSGQKVLAIDETTLNILREIGWKTKQKDVVVGCDNLEDNGIASMYSNYNFTYNSNGNSIDNVQWSYSVRLANNSYEEVASQNGGTTFEICSVANKPNLYINSDGDSEGVIKLKYSLNNIPDSTQYNISLGRRPLIFGIYDVKINDNDYLSYYDFSFSVLYAGSNRVIIGVEQEYSCEYELIYVNEPHLAHVNVPLLNKGNYVWIDISISNEYGTTTQTIELGEQYTKKRPLFSDIEEMQNNECCENVSHIDVYSVLGVKIATIKNLTELENVNHSLLVLNYISNGNNVIKTRKIKLKKR